MLVFVVVGCGWLQKWQWKREQRTPKGFENCGKNFVLKKNETQSCGGLLVWFGLLVGLLVWIVGLLDYSFWIVGFCWFILYCCFVWLVHFFLCWIS